MTSRFETLKQIPPLMPQFLRKRRVGVSIVSELLRELGLERGELFTMVTLDEWQGSFGGPVTLAQIRADDPYSTVDHYSQPLSVLVGKALVVRDADGAFSLSPRGGEVVSRLHTAGRAHVAALRSLPDDELEELAHQLQRAIDGILADPALSPRPGSRLAGRRSLAVFGNKAPAMVRIEQTVFDLWGARDDAHIRAWRDAELQGPPMAVLSTLWYGDARTVSELQRALSADQAPEDVESNLAYLTEKEYVVRDGDDVLQLTPEGALVREDIERETDSIYFTPWPHTETDAAWLRDKLRELTGTL